MLLRFNWLLMKTSFETCVTYLSNEAVAAVTKKSQVRMPMERIAKDVIRPFPTSTEGNRCVVVMVNHFIEWTEAAAALVTIAYRATRLESMV